MMSSSSSDRDMQSTSVDHPTKSAAQVNPTRNIFRQEKSSVLIRVGIIRAQLVMSKNSSWLRTLGCAISRTPLEVLSSNPNKCVPQRDNPLRYLEEVTTSLGMFFSSTNSILTKLGSKNV